MKEINLGNSNLKALVDNEDHIKIKNYGWNLQRSGNINYAQAKINGKMYSMHVFIMKLHKIFGPTIDHKNRNGLDNQKCNLRPATYSENRANQGRFQNNISGYKGVNRNGKKWEASINHNGIKYWLGTFTSRIKAARVYDKKAEELYGEFAFLNFPYVDVTFIPMNLKLF